MATLNPSATPFLPAIASLPHLTPAALASTLDLLFEPSQALHELALPTMRTLSFTSYADLIATLRGQLLELAAAVHDDAAGREKLHSILGSHPRLGEKKVEVLSGLSQAEQSHLRGSGGGGEEAEELARLNAEYEERFPGLRYVVWVNGRPRGEILADMRRRIARGDLAEEEREGIRAMCDIAADRARKLEQKAAEEAVEAAAGGSS